MQGHGLTFSAASAMVSDERVLIVSSPSVQWTGNLSQEQLNQLKAIDLSDLIELALNLDTGVNYGRSMFSLELSYSEGEQRDNQDKKTVQFSQLLTSIRNIDGNLHFQFKEPLDDSLPPVVENIELKLITWVTIEDGLTGLKSPIPIHAACCGCSGWCAFLWTLFAYCSTCVEPQGPAYCCQNCRMPATQQERCPGK